MTMVSALPCVAHPAPRVIPRACIHSVSVVCVTDRLDGGPTWWDFSVSSLTSFAALEKKIMTDYCREVSDACAADAAAAVVAAKYAAALGCSDTEVEGAARKAFDLSCRVLRWREERGGVDEPAAWAARMTRGGHLERLLRAPLDALDDAALEAILPTPARYHKDHGPKYPYLTVGHVFELLKYDSKLAKAVGCARSAVMYCLLYHLTLGRVEEDLEPPTVKEGTSSTPVATDTVKGVYANLERLRAKLKVQREEAQKRAAQGISRQAEFETSMRAQVTHPDDPVLSRPVPSQSHPPPTHPIPTHPNISTHFNPVPSAIPPHPAPPYPIPSHPIAPRPFSSQSSPILFPPAGRVCSQLACASF
jgi:hypothetical protein